MGRQGHDTSAAAPGMRIHRSQSKMSLSASFEALAVYFPCMNSFDEEDEGKTMLLQQLQKAAGLVGVWERAGLHMLARKRRRKARRDLISLSGNGGSGFCSALSCRVFSRWPAVAQHKQRSG